MLTFTHELLLLGVKIECLSNSDFFFQLGLILLRAIDNLGHVVVHGFGFLLEMLISFRLQLFPLSLLARLVLLKCLETNLTPGNTALTSGWLTRCLPLGSLLCPYFALSLCIAASTSTTFTT